MPPVGAPCPIKLHREVEFLAQGHTADRAEVLGDAVHHFAPVFLPSACPLLPLTCTGEGMCPGQEDWGVPSTRPFSCHGGSPAPAYGQQ